MAEDYLFGDPFYYDGYVCVYLDHQSIRTYTEGGTRSFAPLTPEERQKLVSRRVDQADVLEALEDIDLKLNLFKLNCGDYLPLYKFSHRILGEEHGRPLLLNLNAVLHWDAIASLCDQAYEGIARPHWPFHSRHRDLLLDLSELVSAVCAMHSEMFATLMRTEHRCEARLKRHVTWRTAAYALPLAAYAASVRAYYNTLFTVHTKTMRQVCWNLMRVWHALLQEHRLPAYSRGHLLVVHNYFVTFVFERFKRSCQNMRFKFDELDEYIRLYSERVNSFIHVPRV